MSQASQGTPTIFTSTAHARLAEFLAREHKTKPDKIIALTPDASTREYFRVPWSRGKAIAAVYPEAFDPEFHPFLDVTRLFTEAGLPVPEIYAVNGANGIIVQEDLGDKQLGVVCDASLDDEREAYLERAIALIAKIQAATELAHARHSIASRLAFDEAKLAWELNFFFEHFFYHLRGEQLSHTEAAELRAEMNDIAAELAARPRVLCHRDYHTANLMLDAKGSLRIVDYQDARMGPASYDLVSLLLDRQLTPPSLAEMRAHRLFFIEERRRGGLEALDPDEFAREFRLMAMQRGLKAVGTFSYQTAVCGRGAVYAQYIRPTLLIVLRAAEWLDRSPALRRAISARLDDASYC